MIPVRHACNCRLFDSNYEVEPTSGQKSDVSIKCPRCSREQHQVVLAQYRVKMPKRTAPILSERVFCQDLHCLTRICDIGIAYLIIDESSNLKPDMVIMCPKCHSLTRISLSGVVKVV